MGYFIMAIEVFAGRGMLCYALSISMICFTYTLLAHSIHLSTDPASLPSTPGQQTPRPLPNAPLASLIQQQQPRPKRHRQKEELDRNLATPNDRLQARNVAEDEHDDERKQDGGEDEVILGQFVEGGRVLEDGEAAGACGHYVEPEDISFVLT